GHCARAGRVAGRIDRALVGKRKGFARRRNTNEMRTRVPPPPEPEKRTPANQISANSNANRPKQKLAAPLDAGFLGRVYVSTLWLGIVCTACAWFVTKSVIGAGSFA